MCVCVWIYVLGTHTVWLMESRFPLCQIWHRKVTVLQYTLWTRHLVGQTPIIELNPPLVGSSISLVSSFYNDIIAEFSNKMDCTRGVKLFKIKRQKLRSQGTITRGTTHLEVKDLRTRQELWSLVASGNIVFSEKGCFISAHRRWASSAAHTHDVNHQQRLLQLSDVILSCYNAWRITIIVKASWNPLKLHFTVSTRLFLGLLRKLWFGQCFMKHDDEEIIFLTNIVPYTTSYVLINKCLEAFLNCDQWRIYIKANQAAASGPRHSGAPED